ncbi:MAG: SUMF1/EgtB/PvdO family nonheme iron enzyme [Clostridiales bacterium]
MERYALLLGSSQFDDGKYNDLPCVKNDIDGFESILKEYGDFKEGNIKKLLDLNDFECRREIEKFLGRVSSNDYLLFYYSGHGEIDREANKLYFILKNTDHEILKSTSIEKDFIIDCVDENKPRAKVFIIDCCYSGVFSKVLAKSGIKNPQIEKRDMERCVENGRGCYIMTGGGAGQILPVPENGKYSFFTDVLLKGILTGEAANIDGKIYPDELFKYICKHEIEGHNPVASSYGIENREGTHIVIVKTAFKNYNTNIAKKCARIHVVGFKEEESFAWKDIYIPLKVVSDKENKIIDKHTDKKFYKTEELLELSNNLIIIKADPGKGKTTILKCIIGYISMNDNGNSVVYIKLKDYAERNICLFTYIIDSMLYYDKDLEKKSIEKALFDGKIVVLLDGLDEVRGSNKDDVIKEIEYFNNNYKKCKMILTTRIYGFRATSFELSQIFEIDDLRFIDKINYINKFYGAYFKGRLSEDKIKEKVKAIEYKIKNNDEINDLAKNPFLLSILCLVGKNGVLPKYRIELYDECTKILLNGKEELDKACFFEKQRLLREISFDSFENGGKGEFVTEDLFSKLKEFIKNSEDCKDCKPKISVAADKCLESLCNDSGILKMVGDTCEFIHRTFFEYFTSVKLKKDCNFNDVCQKMNNAMWEQPLKLYAAQINNVTMSKYFFVNAWQANIKLALSCYTEMRYVHKEMIEAVVDNIKISDRIALIRDLPFIEDRNGNNAGAMVDVIKVLIKSQSDLEILAHAVLKLRNIKEKIEDKDIKNTINEIIDKILGDEDMKKTRYNKYIGNLMVKISSGDFMMGSPEDEPERCLRWNSEKEEYEVVEDEWLHKVRVKGFKIMKHTVTLDIFNKFLENENFTVDSDGKRGSYVPNYDKGEWELKSGVDFKCDVNGNERQDQSHPVIHINWYEAWMFCELLGCKLPTEAQWEYACRRRDKDTNICTYTPFNIGTDLPTDKANYNGNYPYNNNPIGEYKKDTMPVMSYEANGVGLYEMHGNVVEWCNDWYERDYYKECIEKNIIDDPKGPDEGSYRVLRGGSWNYFARRCRSAYRGNGYPSYRADYAGFRVVGSP